jgi:hypothetical protein
VSTQDNWALRAQILLLTGLRKLTGTARKKFLVDAFDFYINEPTTLFRYKLMEIAAMKAISGVNLNDMYEKTELTYFHGYGFQMEKLPDRILFTPMTRPAYGSPDTVQHVLVASCFQCGKKVDLTNCLPEKIEEALKRN